MATEKPLSYRKKKTQIVTAVRLDLDTPGFSFEKWGHTQFCQAGDWLVNSDDDCYTVAGDTFAKTYKKQSPGRFLKHAHVHAERASSNGQVKTQEGLTDYKVGDYIVVNTADPTDTYAVTADKFHQLYEQVNV